MKQKLMDDLKQAMRSRDKLRLSVIRLVMSAVKNTEIARRADLSDADIFGVIAKEVRQRQESIEAFKQGNRQALVAYKEDYVA